MDLKFAFKMLNQKPKPKQLSNSQTWFTISYRGSGGQSPIFPSPETSYTPFSIHLKLQTLFKAHRECAREMHAETIMEIRPSN